MKRLTEHIKKTNPEREAAFKASAAAAVKKVRKLVCECVYACGYIIWLGFFNQNLLWMHGCLCVFYGCSVNSFYYY